MVYALFYKSEELLEKNYIKLRTEINPSSDNILLYLSKNYSYAFISDIYKLILKIEGKIRSESDTWSAPKISVKILNH